MKIRRPMWLGAVPLAAILLGVVMVVPALAATSTQSDEPPSDAYAAMHEACEQGDVQGMADAMDILIDADWEAMKGHIGDGHQRGMGSGMMGMRGMMGGWPGRSMMNW